MKEKESATEGILVSWYFYCWFQSELEVPRPITHLHLLKFCRPCLSAYSPVQFSVSISQSMHMICNTRLASWSSKKELIMETISLYVSEIWTNSPNLSDITKIKQNKNIPHQTNLREKEVSHDVSQSFRFQ